MTESCGTSAPIHAPPHPCTASTRARTLSSGVCGRMPCPRLKMWPGRPPTRRKQHGRIQISLHRDVPEAVPGLDQIDAPVETDDIPSRLPHRAKEASGLGSEVDEGRPGGDAPDDAPCVRQDELAVVGRIEA